MSLEQQRAKFAWEKAKASPNDFTSLAKGAPALIMGNGLMAALAFWNSRKTEQGNHLVTALLGWLKERRLAPAGTTDETWS
ncbi:MAG TPA: type III-B CRISPR module-associated protein Cmr5, partial [Candidatus Ozemobacteraceae bacterium]|nr:type III-B CRISPR module-associated protein Cmr5 [Candidatus Ozemobacteraceae bacterium]